MPLNSETQEALSKLLANKPQIAHRPGRLVFDEAISYIIEDSLSHNGVISYQSVANFTLTLRENKYDAHTVGMGQNGTGKSYGEMILTSHIQPFNADNVIYPFMSTKYLIDKICSGEQQNYMIDELSKFFNYKQSMGIEQQALFTAIEIARSNRNAFFNCTRDISRVNNNYRNGKAQIIIWHIDRYLKPLSIFGREAYSFAAVLAGNPVFELEDKFYISYVKPSFNSASLLGQIETLPSFVGYMFFDNVLNHVKASEVKKYEDYKKAGINYTSAEQQQRITNKDLKLAKLRENAEKKEQQRQLSEY